MYASFLRTIALTVSTLMIAGAVAAPRPHSVSTASALSQPANDGNDPGGSGGNDPNPCTDNCVVRAL